MKSVLGLGEGTDREDSERKWACLDEIRNEPSGCLLPGGNAQSFKQTAQSERQDSQGAMWRMEKIRYQL